MCESYALSMRFIEVVMI